MPAITSAQIAQLHRRTGSIRNICILAHVDHGKTTLSDSLLASNGIISSKLAGKVRYLDSREDEQLRGITMESSAISLFFNVKTIDAEGGMKSNEYLINLIDSPGHVDFSSEVSSASRLCDGALVLIDSVEGVCTQTQMVLHQALREKIQPILVFNKIDRLITELQMTPLEAYIHLNKILEQVNAIMAGFFTDEIITKDARTHEAMKAKRSKEQIEAEAAEDVSSKLYDWNLEERDDDEMYFSPEKGNVIFSSAIDGWAFRLQTFADVYAKKLGIKESVFLKCLWGDYYFDPKTKKVLLPKHLKGRNLKPMFVQFVFDNIWAVYESVVLRSDPEKVLKIITALNIKVLPRDLRSKDCKILLSAIFTQWLPISTAVLLSVIEKVPSPLVSQPSRLPRIWFPEEDIIPPPSTDLEKAVFGCSTDSDAPVVGYVSKTLYVSKDALPENRRVQLSAEEMREMRTRAQLLKANPELNKVDGIKSDEGAPLSVQSPDDEPASSEDDESETLLGFARIFSGAVRVGQKLYALGPKYHPDRPDEHCTEFTVQKLYLFMGRELTSLTEVPAGNVFGIAGLEGHLLKSGTISSTKECHNLGALRRMAAPILRVALEPFNLAEMPRLVEGLRLLNQSDPCVEVIVQETGEHVLVTAGELHLERCLTDLRERFSKIEIQVSPPIVPFRETVAGSGSVELETKGFTLGLRLVALPPTVVTFLTAHTNSIRALQAKGYRSPDDLDDAEDLMARSAGRISLDAFQEKLRKLFAETKDPQWDDVVDHLWAFGPKRVGPNLLVTRLDYSHPSLFETLKSGASSQLPHWLESRGISIREFEEGLVMGFQLFTSAGPLCGEPLVGTCCFVDSFTFADTPDAARFNSGQLISTMKEACRSSFLAGAPRLMLAMYSCDIQATSEVLGRVYGVINKRRGKILSEEMKEGTSFFQIASRLPVVESFNFANEIRSRTSGAAIPQLIFSGFELLDQDPFWVPSTEEELEDLGEKADRENIAKRYMENVRKRKGLFVEKKVVESAEKQRTLKK
ncbi:Cytoplasmic GTPase/eEF2-like protein (ribosomal biogenesis) [Entomophthora muscae]|uniref:Cytoplasmic GTPase/eEF2-like protein (Ribosomal biogenesis) n=1 Tax=Entomophthora muscae TaxID=34485 RepID=A0ACC2S0A7_9FUNG|nr:Cytoplasmic GTPase/eEF2-like protein (ribosomal biogenesis) [Entomophthora muscae]